MELAVIASDPPHKVARSITLRTRVATDTASIHDVGLLHFMSNTGRLREVSKGQMHIGEVCFALLIDAPADDAHLGCIPETLAFPLYVVLRSGTVNEIMAGLTERDEIIRTIATCLS